MGRKRGRRFRKALDAAEQLEGIEHAQQAARKGKTRKRIDRITKSEKRLDNWLNKIKTSEEAQRQFT